MQHRTGRVLAGAVVGAIATVAIVLALSGPVRSRPSGVRITEADATPLVSTPPRRAGDSTGSAHRSTASVQGLLRQELTRVAPILRRHSRPRVLHVPQVIDGGWSCEVATGRSPCVTAVPRTLFAVMR